MADLNDELLDQKSRFIARMQDLAQILSNTEMKAAFIGQQVKRSIIVVAIDDLGDKSNVQSMIAAMGFDRHIELAAESLIEHPELGALIISKVMQKLIRDGEFEEMKDQQQETAKAKKGITIN